MQWSAQKINKNKSSVLFSRNFRGQGTIIISNLLQLKRLLVKTKHLGLPSIIPRNKAHAVEDLKQKLFSKITGWKSKLLSQAGRTTMIRAVAAAIPSYPLSFVMLPRYWCKEVDWPLKNFWWGFPSEKQCNLTLRS